MGRGFRLLVFHDFHADHQAAAAHIAHHGMGLYPSVQAFHHMVPDNFRVLDRFAFKNVHGGQSSFNADWIAAKRGSMRARDPIHDLRAGEHYAQRHAGGDALGDGDDVRLNAGVLDSPPFTAASRATLDLVGDEKDTVGIANAAQLAQKLGWGWQVSAFTLDWLNKDGSTFFRRHDGLEDAVFNKAYAFGNVL